MGKKIRNTILAGFGALYILNKGALPIMTSMALEPFKFANNPKIQKVMETGKYKHIYNGNNEEIALKYLKLGHAITMKHLELGRLPYGALDNESLNSKTGNCTETSLFSHSNYLYLIKSANKPELSRYVRVATGGAETEGNSGGHQWLEILQNKKWVPYETTLDDLSEETKIDPKSIDKLVSTESVLNPKDFKYYRTNIFQENSKGEVESKLDFQGILKSDGIIYLLAKVLLR